MFVYNVSCVSHEEHNLYNAKGCCLCLTQYDTYEVPFQFFLRKRQSEVHQRRKFFAINCLFVSSEHVTENKELAWWKESFFHKSQNLSQTAKTIQLYSVWKRATVVPNLNNAHEQKKMNKHCKKNICKNFQSLQELRRESKRERHSVEVWAANLLQWEREEPRGGRFGKRISKCSMCEWQADRQDRCGAAQSLCVCEPRIYWMCACVCRYPQYHSHRRRYPVCLRENVKWIEGLEKCVVCVCVALVWNTKWICDQIWIELQCLRVRDHTYNRW